MHASRTLPRRSRSLGASPLNVTAGLVAVAVAGYVVWRFAAPASLGDADTSNVAVEVDQLLGIGAAATADAPPAVREPAGNGLRSDEFRAPEGTSVADAAAAGALSNDMLKQMADQGRADISEEAKEIMASGGVIPSHWVRMDPNGLLVVKDPGALAPTYAAIKAPHGDIVELSTEGLPKAGIWRGKPAIEDLDGDGRLDIVASLRMWGGGNKGEGLHAWLARDGGYEENTRGLRRDLGYGGVDVADLDGDGRLDLAFACHNGSPRAYLCNGFDEEAQWTEVSTGLEGMGVCTDVEIADFTGDGRADLACIGLFSGTGGLYVYSYDPSAKAWFVQAELLPPNDFGYQVRSADIDGDGRVELVAATNRGPKIYSYDGERFVDRSAGLTVPIIGGTLLQVLPHDFDGDGTMELLTLGLHTEVSPPLGFFRLVDGEWQSIDAPMPQTESIKDAEFVEIDGDEGVELVMLGLEGLMVADVDLEKGVRVRGRLGEKENYYHLSVADMNGDGKDEAVIVQTGGIKSVDLAASLATVSGSTEVSSAKEAGK
ncbi:MAG: VCBS repeat-containing protein [Planctomycetota bacterium]